MSLFVRVTFQFLARVLAAVCRISGLTTCLGRSFQGLVEPNPVLAGVAETHRTNQVEGLNVPLAVGLSFFHDVFPEGKCFAPLVAQAVPIVPYTA